MAAVAPTYSDQSVYPAGAYRWYNGVLYKSKVAITTAESFTAAHWKTVSLADDVAEKVEKKIYFSPVSITKDNGIVKYQDLSVFTGSVGYEHTSMSVSAGDIYKVSGYTTGAVGATNYYPCAFITDGTQKRVLVGGSNAGYSAEIVTIPFSGTMYLNGKAAYPVSATKKTVQTDAELYASIDNAYKYKCMVDSNEDLCVKWKNKAGTHEIIMVFGNVGGNSLFNFKYLYMVANSGDLTDNFDVSGAIYSWAMNGSDWFGLYKVAALENADGDTPTNEYFTGGNHRTTNSATGGGITASEDEKEILVNGSAANQNTVYMARGIVATWTNLVNGYNTSKEDGSGRNVLKEKWTLTFDDDGIKCDNVITALEEIDISTYYGLQATIANTITGIRFHGGSNRGVLSPGESVNSGNNICRTAELSNVYITMLMNVYAEDLGLFDYNLGKSFFTSATKLYAYLIAPAHTLRLSQNETAYVKGKYVFE